MNQNKKHWYQFRDVGRKGYGRFALFALVVALIKGGIDGNVQIGVFWEMLSDIIITIGIVCAILWVIKSIKINGKE